MSVQGSPLSVVGQDGRMLPVDVTARELVVEGLSTESAQIWRGGERRTLQYSALWVLDWLTLLMLSVELAFHRCVLAPERKFFARTEVYTRRRYGDWIP